MLKIKLPFIITAFLSLQCNKVTEAISKKVRFALIVQIDYHTLYIKIGSKKQDVINQRVNEDVVLDIGEGDRIIGIEIMNAAKRINLKETFPVKII